MRALLKKKEAPAERGLVVSGLSLEGVDRDRGRGAPKDKGALLWTVGVGAARLTAAAARDAGGRPACPQGFAFAVPAAAAARGAAGDAVLVEVRGSWT